MVAVGRHLALLRRPLYPFLRGFDARPIEVTIIDFYQQISPDPASANLPPPRHRIAATAFRGVALPAPAPDHGFQPLFASHFNGFSHHRWCAFTPVRTSGHLTALFVSDLGVAICRLTPRLSFTHGAFGFTQGSSGYRPARYILVQRTPLIVQDRLPEQSLHF